MGFLSWSWELGCKVMTSRHVPLDRRIFYFWFLISDFWFPFSVFRFPISNLRFPISDFRFPISLFPFPISHFGFPKSRSLISVFGNHKIPAINFWFLIHEIQKTDWLQSFLLYYAQAEKRLNSVKKRLMCDDKYCTDYCSFMSDIISKGYARKVDDDLKRSVGQNLVPAASRN